MAAPDDPDAVRAQQLESWEHAAPGWGRQAGQIRDLPVSSWMIEQVALQPGQRVLELAAGPGDTGLLAAELIRPGGTLISSDAIEAMVSLSRTRAASLGIDNVEFKQLELEWIDLPTATVDVVLCRFGVMLIVDPAAALREMRRVLAPGGRVALAVWDVADLNPWATIPRRALDELGFGTPVDPDAPGMFSLSDQDELSELVLDAGFVSVRVEPIPTPRRAASAEAFIDEMLDLSHIFARRFEGLGEADQARVRERFVSLLAPFTADDGAVEVPGMALGASAEA